VSLEKIPADPNTTPKEARPTIPSALGTIETLAFSRRGIPHQSSSRHARSRASPSRSAGEISYAFVGPSGRGEGRPLVKLLVGLYRPQTGTIVYNGGRATASTSDALPVPHRLRDARTHSVFAAPSART